MNNNVLSLHWMFHFGKPHRYPGYEYLSASTLLSHYINNVSTLCFSSLTISLYVVQAAIEFSVEPTLASLAMAHPLLHKCWDYWWEARQPANEFFIDSLKSYISFLVSCGCQKHRTEGSWKLFLTMLDTEGPRWEYISIIRVCCILSSCLADGLLPSWYVFTCFRDLHWGSLG